MCQIFQSKWDYFGAHLYGKISLWDPVKYFFLSGFFFRSTLTDFTRLQLRDLLSLWLCLAWPCFISFVPLFG